MPQGSKAGFRARGTAGRFLNCGGNGPDDILKFP
jgi:hypothetical protein